MKKTILIAAAIAITLPGIAQDRYVVNANLALKSKDYEEAKTEIDKAMANPETAKKHKAMFAKAQVYFMLQNEDKYKDAAPYKEGLAAALDLVAAKPDYEKATVSQLLMLGGFLSYNDGVKAYNDKKYDEAVELMKTVVKVSEADGGKAFAKFPESVQKQMDTVVADAYLTMANAAYFSGKIDEAIPLLIKVNSNPIRKSASVYQVLADAYGKKENTAQQLATIEEGRKLYPNDVTLRNNELNFYIKAGRMDDLLKKLEEASAKEPANADLHFNLATTYLSMAGGKDGKKPANAAELYTKSEAQFNQALKIDPSNVGFNYNFGALYFNKATDVNDKINAITGSSKEDIDKYDRLKKERDDFFVKSQPYFEKVFEKLSPKESSLAGEDLRNYKSSLMALNKIYAIQSKLDKAADMKARMDKL